MGVHHSKGKRFKSPKRQSRRKSKALSGISPPVNIDNNTNIDTTIITDTQTTSANVATTTSVVVSDGADIRERDNNPNNGGEVNLASSGNIISLRESTIFEVTDVDIRVDEGGICCDDGEIHSCALCETVSHDKLYCLEVCGHGFCLPCIFEFSETKLKDLPSDCYEILCPLDRCGCVISVDDLRRGISAFGGNILSKSDPGILSIHNNNDGVELELEGVASVGGSGSNSGGPSALKSLPIQLTQSLETFLAKNSNYVHCPNPQCKFVFERLPPTRTHEVVLDEHGEKLSSVALKHRQMNRFRCRACDTNFCASCKTIPYHLGFTCKTYFLAKAAKHCRFCDVVLPSNTKPHESCIKVSSTPSKEKKSRSFLNIKWKTKDKKLGKESKKGKSKGPASPGEKEDPELDDAEKDGIPQEFYVCNSEECKTKMKSSCRLFLDCGHFCRGTSDFEPSGCMCLESNCPSKLQDGDDYCNICWVEGLKNGPCIKLGCGHVFHYTCVKKKLSNKWPGPSISFAYAACPLCQEPISHVLFASELSRITTLRQEVKTKALDRLKIEGLMEDPQVTTEGSPYYNNPEDFAVHIFAFYECHLCKHAYFGGRRQCEIEAENVDMSKHNPQELICPGCSTINAECSIHGKDYIDFKCRFCCSLATYFCGGKAHFCTPCHDKAGQLVEFSNWTTIAKCPPCKGKPDCPLGLNHAENGQEFAMGCSMCRADQKHD